MSGEEGEPGLVELLLRVVSAVLLQPCDKIIVLKKRKSLLFENINEKVCFCVVLYAHSRVLKSRCFLHLLIV